MAEFAILLMKPDEGIEDEKYAAGLAGENGRRSGALFNPFFQTNGNPCDIWHVEYFRAVRDFNQPSPGLEGSLLVAHPSLIDPNFKRSVLFLTSNDQQSGSHGLIINRPTGNTVGDLLSSQKMGPLARLPVFTGGPVGNDQLTFAAFRRLSGRDIIECKSHLEIEEAEELAVNEFASVRAFIGYSGWSKQQLEAELAQKAWIVRDPDPEAFNIENCNDLWQSIMRELGPWFRLLALAPDDPSRN